jgi:hypothetical protein
MNLWTFLDRNGGGIGLLIIFGLCFAFGSCGDAKNREGCRVRCGTGEVSISPSDGGAP